MLSIWSTARGAFEPAAALAGMTWVHAAAPSADELGRLERELAVPAAFFKHALDVDEVARVDHEGTASLVVVRMPTLGERGEPPFVTQPLALVVVPGAVITISPASSEALGRLDLSQLDLARPFSLVLRLLERIAERFLADLREVDRAVDEVEARLEASLRNREVLELLRYQKVLVRFERALAANDIVLQRLLHDERFARGPADAELLEDLGVEFRQATEMVRISTEILSQTMDAFASIISNNLNVVMKVLTSLTILLAVPTAVASFYGMNVALPLGGHARAFELTLGVSVVLVLAVAAFFRKRRWL